MDKQQSLIIKKYVDLLYRWKFLLIILILIGLPAGLLYYVNLPKVYQATSLLSYERQRINPSKLSPDVKERIHHVVSTLTQLVTSRTNLEELISTYNLYENQRKYLPLEDVINLMKRNITIKPSKRGDTFYISFSGGDPQKVAKVTNAIAAKFIEENLKYRQSRATETSKYTSNELEMAKLALDKKEASMRDYKLKYYNELPEQRGGNVQRLTALQEQYQGMQESILELGRTRVLIQEQISLRKKTLSAQATGLVAAIPSKGSNKGVLTPVQQLAQMQQQLDTLRVRYTEQHPEIKRYKKLIARMENEIALNGSSESTTPRRRPNIGRIYAADRDLTNLQTELKEIAFNIERIEREKEQLVTTIKKYENWVAATPEREAEWSALSREYDQLKAHYEGLVTQNLQATSSLNLERRQKGSQFKVEDPARVPGKPISPDFLKIMVFAVAGAIGGGVGFLLIVSFLDGSIRDPDEIEHYLGIPVVSTVPYVTTVKERRRGIFIQIALVVITICGVFAVSGLFWYFGTRGDIII